MYRDITGFQHQVDCTGEESLEDLRKRVVKQPPSEEPRIQNELPSDEYYYRGGFSRGCLIGVVGGGLCWLVICIVMDLLFRAAVLGLFEAILQAFDILGG